MRIFILFLLSSITCLKADIDISGLDRNQRDKLFRGQMVMLEEKVENAPWPKLKFYKLLDADIEEFSAYFSDFASQKDYIPNLVKSEIITEEAPLKIDVKYELDLPWPLSNAKYVNTHKIEKLQDNHYIVSWKSLESSVADDVTGYSEFVRFNNKTLWYYENFTRPKSILAGLFEGSMKFDTGKSLEVTAQSFESLKQDNPAKLQESINLWRKRVSNSTK